MKDAFIDFFIIAVLVTLALVVIFSIAIGVSIANSQWNCSSWHKNTGEKTQVMAGECYVQEGDKWVIFGTHIRNHHVEIEKK